MTRRRPHHGPKEQGETGQSPQHHSGTDPFTVAGELLQAEADRLAREGRRLVADVDGQSDLSRWTRTVTGRRGGAVSDRTVTVLDGTGDAQ